MFKKLIDNFIKNKFLTNVIFVASGTAFAQAISLLAAPIITRLYSPADFGIFTVFAAFVGISSQLSTLRYSVAIPLAEKEELAFDILKLCLLITMLLSIVLGLGVWLFGDYFTIRFSVLHAAQYFWLFPLCLMGAGFYEALASWAVRGKYFKLIAQTRLSQSISSSAIKVGLGWIGVKPLGLLLGLLATHIAGSARIFLKLYKEKSLSLRSISLQGLGYAAKKYIKFPLFQSWSRLLLSLGIQLPAIFLAGIYGAEVVGFFGLAVAMVNMPMNLLGKSVAQVYFAEIAQYGHARPDKIFKLSLSIVKKMFFIAIIPMTIIMAVGPWVFDMAFGSHWRTAGVYARFISLLMLGRFLSTPVMQCLDVLEKQLIQLLINIFRVVSIIVIFWGYSEFRISSENAIVIYSIYFSLFHVGVIGVTLYIIYKQKVKLMNM